MNIIQAIFQMILGTKYYANIINTRGTADIELSCYIFDTRQQADEHARSLQNNRSFMFLETISFRSRRQLTDKKTSTRQ